MDGRLPCSWGTGRFRVRRQRWAAGPDAGGQGNL